MPNPARQAVEQQPGAGQGRQVQGPRVSVLMAVHNTRRYLQDALESIRGQSFTDFELIAIDDGSTDGSTEVLRAFAAREPRLRLIARENRGLIATRNELLREARGELIAWADSDDVSTTNRLAEGVSRFDEDDALVCLGSAAQRIDPDGNFLDVERFPLEHEGILVAQQAGGGMRFPTTMMRRDVTIRVGGFRAPFTIGEDFDLFLRMSEVGKMANLPDVLYFYRQHHSSICATMGSQWAVYRDLILQLADERKSRGSDRLQRGEPVRLDQGHPAGKRDFECRTLVHWSEAALENGNPRLARTYAWSAVRRSPLNRKAIRNLLRAFRPRS